MPDLYKQTANREVERLRLSLYGLQSRLERIDPATEIAGDMSRYFCVRISGFLEQAVVAYSRSLVEQSSWGPGQAHGLSHLKKSFNANSSALQTAVMRFSKKWAEELGDLLAADERSQRLNALLGIRNDIAHGKNQGVSLSQANDYLKLVEEVIDWFACRFEPLPGAERCSEP